MNPFDISEVLRAWNVTPCGIGKYIQTFWRNVFQVRDIASYLPHYIKSHNVYVLRLKVI